MSLIFPFRAPCFLLEYYNCVGSSNLACLMMQPGCDEGPSLVKLLKYEIKIIGILGWH
uniref:Uncharacterized protein n=1 Tax=Rhizophora mucronata TaxID=61149 RepID=A0A2P2Q4K9_RHIMU